MRKVLPFIFFAGLAMQGRAQTISFLLPTVPCHNDGVLVANMTGFTPPLTVTWFTAGTTGANIFHTVTSLTDALTGYSGGAVSISVSDATHSASATYGGAPPFTYALTTTGAICPAPGTATVAVTGGTAPYTYQWFDAATGTIVGSGLTTSQPSGTYGVNITDGAGCTFGSRVNSDNGFISYTSFSATVTATPAACKNGTAVVAAVDPTAVLPVSYAWTNGATTASVSELATGSYSVTITDAAGCKAVDPGFMGSGFYSPPAIFIGQTSSLTTAVTATATSCHLNNGSIGVAVSGGTPPYSYLWNNGATTATQTGIPWGTYEVTVTDANGCITTDFGAVNFTSPLSVTSSSTASLCTSPTGNATIVPSGGTGTYSIVWYTTPAYTGPTATFLAPGEYAYKVTDGAGCERAGTVRVAPINRITTNFSSVSASCTAANGSVTVMPVGGVAPYTYSWNTGGTSATLASVAAGTYTVTVTDGMSCKVKETHEVASASTVGVALSSTPASCVLNNDGSITATAFGGIAPYSYGWSSGGTTSVITGLQPGNYWLQVTDAAGCTASNYTHVGYDASNTSCYCTIQGTIFADTNGNCTQEPGEAGIPHMQVFCSGQGYTYTDARGGYSFQVPSGSYVITENNPAYYPLSFCQTNNIPVSTTAGAGCVNTVNFANSVAGVHNITIATSSASQPVGSQPYKQKITVINEGNVYEDSVFTGYKSDGQLFTPWFTPSTVFTGSGYYYNNTATYTALAPGQSVTYYASYNVPANIPVGTYIYSRDSAADRSAANYLTDNTPWNNTNIYSTQIVAASLDNFIEVSPRGSGTNGLISYADSTLTYTIHFGNSEPLNIENVMITDTIDANLDWTTLHPVFESSPCKVTMSSVGAFKIATFTFSNVNLGERALDNLRTSGSVTFSIKTMPGLAVGSQFHNHASVMFDMHQPKATNTTVNTLTNIPVAVNNAPARTTGSFAVFPNPATATFTAVVNCTNPCNASMNMTDVTGKNMLTKTISLQSGTQNIATDISNFAPGIYFVSIDQAGKVETQKLVIIK